MLKKQFIKSPKIERNLVKYDYEEDLSQSFLASRMTSIPFKCLGPQGTFFICLLIKGQTSVWKALYNFCTNEPFYGYNGVKGGLIMKEAYKNILVAVDSSDQARRAFQEAIEVTRRNEAHLHILIVADTNRLGAEPYAVDHIMKNVNKAANAVVESLEELLPPDITHTSVIDEGNPKATIVAYAEQEKIDLIIMGATGTGTFSRLLLGSTTAYVVNNAPCNVMVVR